MINDTSKTREFLLGLFIHYDKAELFTEAEKAAQKYVELFSDEYTGYHLLYMALRRQNQTFRMQELVSSCKRFEQEEGYWEDYLDLIDLTNGSEYLVDHMDELEQCKEKAPYLFYREKIGALLRLERFDEYHKTAEECCQALLPRDPRLSDLITAYNNEDFLLAGRIANTIISQDRDTKSISYFLALNMQIIILMQVTEEPTDETVHLLKRLLLLLNSF